MFYDIEKVKEIEVETVCELYGIELRRKGQNLWGKIRNEKTDSFSINPAKNIWRDWGMAEGGDVIALVSKLESTSYAEAIKIVGSRFNIPTEDRSEEYKSLPTPKQFKEININSTRVSLNLDINLEKNTVEEVEKMYSDKKYSLTMYELSKIDKELYHQIIDGKSLELIERDSDIFGEINKKYKKETGKVEKMLYKDMLEELEININNGIEIYNRSRLDSKDLNKLKVKFEPEMKKIEVEDLISKIEKSVEEYTETPEQLKEYMKFMSKFHKYSVSNNFLMQSQFVGASAVGSFKFWKDKGFSVNKGEKAIKILVPNKVTPKFLDENGKWKPLSKAGEKEKDKVKNGELELSEKLYFSIGNVFDVSQTNAKAEDLPGIFPNKWLDGNVKNYSVLYKGLENIAKSIDVKIIEPKSELGVSKGCSYILTKEVALNPRNSELQNFKTLLHELAHAKLHNAETNSKYTSAEKEFEAELTAFTVCSYFNIDTSEYSLNYLNHWSKGEIRDKQELLKEVNSTVKEYIGVLEETLINEKYKTNINNKQIDQGLNNKEINISEEKYIYTFPDKNIQHITSIGEIRSILVDNYIEINSDIKKVELFKESIRSISENELLVMCEATGFKVSNEKPIFSEIESKDLATLWDTCIIDEIKFKEKFKASSLRITNPDNTENYIIVTPSDGNINYEIFKNNKAIGNLNAYQYDKLTQLIEDIYISSTINNLTVSTEVPIQKNEVGAFFSGEKIENNIFIYYKYIKEEYTTISTLEDLKDFVIDYTGTFFEEDMEDENESINSNKENEFENDVRNNWNEKNFLEWCETNEITVSLEHPLKNKDLKEEIHQKVNIKDKEDVSEMISELKEKEVIKKIKDHEEWINSKGTRGAQLNLENENIRGMKFLDVDLRSANMKNADLRDCIFFADLKGANLTGAKIENSKFIGSNLGEITIEANKLNLIEYQIEQEIDKHKWANKSLSTNVKNKKLERE